MGGEAGEFEEGLVDYGFLFVLFVAANVAVCGEAFGEGEFDGVDGGSVPGGFDGHAAVVVHLVMLVFGWAEGLWGRVYLVGSEGRYYDKIAYSLFNDVDVAGEAFEIVYGGEEVFGVDVMAKYVPVIGENVRLRRRIQTSTPVPRHLLGMETLQP